jgi:hypothetical protein
MLPGRIEGYPQGSQRSANTAERLLSQAVGWWDAAAYRDGDRLLRNRGVAGELLDLQLGSSDRVATTNDPLFLAPEDTGYVYLPGSVGDFLSVPDENALDITGDIDIRARIARDNWTSPHAAIIAKWSESSSRSFFFRVENNTGRLNLFWTPDGTFASSIVKTSSVAPTVANGASLWVRVTLDVDNGASGNDVKFFTSNDGVNWTQLGTTVTTAGVTSIFAGTDPVRIGRAVNTISFNGKVYAAQIWDGIEGSGGTKVLDIDCDVITDGSATSFTAVTGQTVTINRSTSGRKAVAVPSRSLKKWDDPHVFLPGVAGNSLSVPDEAALDITGDIDLRFYGAISFVGTRVLIVKTDFVGVDIAYRFDTDSTGRRLRFTWSTNGSAGITAISESNIVPIDGTATWYRVTLDVDNGNSEHEVKFYTSNDGVSWTQFGSTFTGAGTTSIFSNSAPLRVGARGTSNDNALTGSVYRAQVLDGIGGTTVLDIDCAKAPTNFISGQPITFLADTGQTVTLNSTAGSGMEVRGTRFSSGRSLFLLGTDDYFECVGNWQHQLLNFRQGESVSVLIVIRQYPNPMGSRGYIGKWILDGSAQGFGWDILSQSTSVVRPRAEIAYGTQVADSAASAAVGVFGEVTLMSFARDTANKVMNVYTNNTQFTLNDPGGNASNTISMRIGSRGGPSNFFEEFEFTAAAVFRRALTPAEISLITDYYQNRGY